MKPVAGVFATLALLASASPIESGNSNNNNNNNITSHVRNANHIFNSIHSSMRQWGSAWCHNGMSFYLASVPAGTQFYHGTRFADRINGTEWLAFEPEHALIFASLGKGPGKGPGGHKPFPPMRNEVMKNSKQEVLFPANKADDQEEDDNDEGKEEEEWGYLHTYAANKDLRLLYLDGLSAGKTSMGTTDAGDRIFLQDRNLTLPDGDGDGDDNDHHYGLDGEYARARIGCEIARNDWNGRIDGVLRAEAGFEIILCDFARDLDVVRINAVKKQQGDIESGYFHRAIAARYDGIGGGRVRINYDNFVTAFAYEDLDLFNGGENEMPRLAHFASEELQPIRDDLTRLVMEHEITTTTATTGEPLFNWQSIVDMIVTKYSNLLMFFASDEMDSLQSLQANITMLFLPFIDGRQRDAAAETERCTTQFTSASPRPSSRFSPRQSVNLNTTTPPPLAGQVVYDVSYSICSTLRSVLDDTDFTVAASRITNLIDYLAWTTWKECKTKCGYSQVCYIPIWPFGTVQDRLNPQCKDGRDDLFGGGGERYWRDWFGVLQEEL